jgi:hypothetical protein
MTTILGNNVHVFLDSTEVFCAKDCALTESKDSVEMAGGFTLPGRWTYNRLQRRSWKVDCSGLSKINSSEGTLDYFSIVDDPFATDFHTLEITFDDPDGNNVTFTGTVFIPKSSITGPVKESAGASVSFIGTGRYLLSTEATSSGSSGSGGSGGPDFCVPVAGGNFAPPTGTSNDTYLYTFALTGTNPKVIGATTLPSWMFASIVSGNLHLFGTPSLSDVGAGITVSVQVTNDCGDETFSATIDVLEDGRNVFVINNSTHTIILQNDNGHSYTFPPSNNGNIKMQSSTVNITSISGGGGVNYQFLQSLPSLVINSGSTFGGNIVTFNLSITNYLRFS